VVSGSISIRFAPLMVVVVPRAFYATSPLTLSTYCHTKKSFSNSPPSLCLFDYLCVGKFGYKEKRTWLNRTSMQPDMRNLLQHYGREGFGTTHAVAGDDRLGNLIFCVVVVFGLLICLTSFCLFFGLFAE
jgi:hypothetical protein